MNERLKGKEFEALILFRATKLEEAGILTMTRYGVQAVMINNRETGKPEWQIIKSLPDFDGCLKGGQQIVIEAKVCSGPSYPLYQTGKKHPKQIDHMLRRARFGALCFLMIHFNEQVLMRSTKPAETFAIPVNDDDSFWREYAALSRRTVTRDEAAMYGIAVPWNQYSERSSKLTPDLRVLLPEKEFELTA